MQHLCVVAHAPQKNQDELGTCEVDLVWNAQWIFTHRRGWFVLSQTEGDDYTPPDLPHIVNSLPVDTHGAGYRGTYRPLGRTIGSPVVAVRSTGGQGFDWLAAIAGGSAVVVGAGAVTVLAGRNRRRIATSG